MSCLSDESNARAYEIRPSKDKRGVDLQLGLRRENIRDLLLNVRIFLVII